MSNLPEWPGAAHCYSQAYRLLEKWGARNYATTKFKGKIKCPTPSDEMKSLIDALDRGDEEKIKGILLLGDEYRTY